MNSYENRKRNDHRYRRKKQQSQSRVLKEKKKKMRSLSSLRKKKKEKKRGPDLGVRGEGGRSMSLLYRKLITSSKGEREVRATRRKIEPFLSDEKPSGSATGKGHFRTGGKLFLSEGRSRGLRAIEGREKKKKETASPPLGWIENTSRGKKGEEGSFPAEEK